MTAVDLTTLDPPRANPLRDPRDRRLPRVPEPCALVVFGVTGDLARKKLLPAVYDLANRGLLPTGFVLARLRPPGLGRRRLRGHGPGGGQRARPHAVAGGGLVPAGRQHPVRPRRVRRRQRVRPAGGDPGRAARRARDPGQRGVLPLDPAGRLPDRAQAAAAHRHGGQRRVRRLAPGGGGEAVRPRPGVARGAQRPGRRRLHRRGRVPDRPLPGQGDGPEHPGAALREHAVRAGLELQLRRLGADHHGRGRRHRQPGRLLRRHRRGPRRAAEPPAAAARAGRDGGAGQFDPAERSAPRS